MNAEHARPMMAYVALCLAASYVLGQGVIGSGTSMGPIEIARAGEPVRGLASIVTVAAAQEIVEAGAVLLPAPIRGAVAASVSTSEPVRRVTNTVASTAPKPAPEKVVATPRLSVPVHGKAAADARKAHRIAERVAATGSPKAGKPAKAHKAPKAKHAKHANR